MALKYILKHHFDGLPKATDFELVQEPIQDLVKGEILVNALFLSVDPYMRPYTRRMTPPFTMIGQGVYQVEQSQDPNFPVGRTVVANIGWVKRGVINPGQMQAADPYSIFLASENTKGLSKSLLLGACGMPGNTAYFGFLEICQPKAGETVLINGAAGAVGSLVGQIAKLKGCRVIGLAGSDEKCHFLTNQLGFDKAYNYKKTKIEDALAEAAPKGVDCFFDNVGGADAAVVINHMNLFGRISVCGAISMYNEKEASLVPATSPTFVFKQLKMEGFIVTRWMPRWQEGIEQMALWIHQGKIQAEETIIEGFDKMPEAFIGLFQGSNLGKMVVKC